jgi:hypothetical protein
MPAGFKVLQPPVQRWKALMMECLAFAEKARQR